MCDSLKVGQSGQWRQESEVWPRMVVGGQVYVSTD
jgi:hypothetical protein